MNLPKLGLRLHAWQSLLKGACQFKLTSRSFIVTGGRPITTNCASLSSLLNNYSTQQLNNANPVGYCKPGYISYSNQWLCSSPIRLSHTSGGNENNRKDVEKSETMLPQLMAFPPIVWPKFFNAIRNWFFINFIIKPYFDKDFSMSDFLVGAKEAVSVISNKLSEGKVEELEGLIEPSALNQIKESLTKFTVFQQQLLRVAVEDIFFTFPFQIGIIIPDEPHKDIEYPEGSKRPPQTRHVEITVCLHVLRGLAEKQKNNETGSNFNFQEFTQDERNKYNVMICNYRFFKDFTEGNPDPSWIVNMVNHFLPSEITRI